MERKLICAVYTAIILLGSGCAPLREFQAKRQIRRGEELLKNDDLEAALAAFQEAAKLSPQMSVPHSKLGLIFRRMGEYEQAIQSFAEAIRRNPFSFDDTFNLAQLYHFTKRVKDAIQAYLHAV